MKVCLVAMPWFRHKIPSLALATLSSYLIEKHPNHIVNCEHAYVEAWRVMGSLSHVIGENLNSAEVIYGAHLYPEKLEIGKKLFSETLFSQAKHRESFDYYTNLFDKAYRLTEYLMDRLVTKLSNQFDMIGFSVTSFQLFSSLVASKKIKKLDKHVKIAFGGQMMASTVGSSILQTYDFVDYIVQGEGEEKLCLLIQQMEDNAFDSASIEGILSRATNKQDQSPDHFSRTNKKPVDLLNLDNLPIPDFSSYSSLAEEYGIQWEIPIEGSRGCWWHRSKDTNNPKHSCYFCSQQRSYRQKSASTISEQMKELSNRYMILNFVFHDENIRANGIGDLTNSIRGHKKDFRFWYQIRSKVAPYDLLHLSEAGCRSVQIGIEGLSSPYLDRIGKGIRTIDNLQAMKICNELRIEGQGNLIIGFPDATSEEIEETANNILKYAIAYAPLSTSTFYLKRDSAVFLCPSEYSIKNIRNHDEIAAMLSDNDQQTLALPWLTYDYQGLEASWEKVIDACKIWNEQYEKRNQLGKTLALHYADGVDFMRIDDNRRHEPCLYTLDKMERDVYMFCMQTKNKNRIFEYFAGTYKENEIDLALNMFRDQSLTFEEQGRVLSLAMAGTPSLAANRIRSNIRNELSDIVLR